MPVTQDLFANIALDKTRFDTDLQAPLPRRKLGILFTPRSGSSWLTDVLRRTRRLGKPNEWFNPNFIPRIAGGVNADSLEGYIEMIMRKHMLGNVFAFEVTIYQLYRVFGTDTAFLAHFPAQLPWVYLRREDMVAQAVSLAKAVRTELFHAPQASAVDLAQADESFEYDPDEIGKWLAHIFDQEQKCEDFLKRNAIKPLRLSYETITREGAEALVARILPLVRKNQTGLPERMLKRLESRHNKIGSDKNTEFATRFMREHPDRMDQIAAFRATCPMS